MPTAFQRASICVCSTHLHARLHEAGIPFNVNIITAAAGPERMLEHARANAQLVNDVKPTLVFVSPLHVDPGAKLEGIVKPGELPNAIRGDHEI